MRELEETLREHSGLIRRIAQTYERDPHGVQDLEQEIALALVHALSRFRGECSVRSFVARVAHNRAVSHLVRERRRPPYAEFDPSLPDRGPTVEEEVDAASERARLLEAVRELPIASRQLVGLWLEGFSMTEIGDAFGITAGNAAVRMARARDRLRTLLDTKG